MNVRNYELKLKKKKYVQSLSADSLPPHPLALLLRRPILLLDSLLKFRVSPVEEDLCALTGYQQALHLDCRRPPVLLHCGVLLFHPLHTHYARAEKIQRSDAKQIEQHLGRDFRAWRSNIHSWGMSLHIY